MANQDQVERLLQSSKQHNRHREWNHWREENSEIAIDLTGVDISRADLFGANLGHADLRRCNFNGAIFVGADLNKAIFRDANLRGSDFTGVDLSDINLRNTDLRNANFRNASLIGTNLDEANLTGASLINADLRGAHFTHVQFNDILLDNTDLTDASFGWTTFSNIDVRPIVGLPTVRHWGPSDIATNVFYRSQGEIPDVFLRGCGIPDEMIDFVHAIGGGIQYYSAFISYNHQNEAFATRLYNDLQAQNVRCWKYTEDMKAGDKIHHKVDQAIRLHANCS